MKARSPLEICAPLGIFALACVLSVPSLIVAVAWMTAGVCSAWAIVVSRTFPRNGFRQNGKPGCAVPACTSGISPGGPGICAGSFIIWLSVLDASFSCAACPGTRRSMTMLALLTATTGINLSPAVQAINAAFAPSGTSRDGQDCEVDRRAAVRGGNAQR